MPQVPVAPYEVLAGPADVYIANVGTAFPAVDATPGGSWTALGMTEGGVTVRHTQDVEQLTTDQYTGPVKAIRTNEGVEVEFAMVNVSLENYAKALNNASVTAAAGPPATKEVLLYRGNVVNRHALLVRGPSVYGPFFMQYQIPVCFQSETPEVAFVKDDKSVLSCVFTTLIDLTAATDAERFGKLVAQTA